MEEEGTVVYFKTSPSVQESHVTEEELVFKDATDIDTSATQPPSAKDFQKSSVGRIFSFFLPLITQIWNLNQGQLTWLLSELKSSPLLTEEDSHIIHFSLTQQPAFPSTTDHQTSVVRFYWTAILVALVAVSLYLETLTLIAVLLPLLILWGVVMIKSRHRQARATHQWQKFSKQCEEMLSSLTKALRLIQETEILSRGYSRPSKAVPVSRLESCTAANLQCVHLRRRVFSVSLTGVLLLRKLTKKLYIRVSTKEELDSAQSYLAFRDLESLHQHMREGAGEEEKYDLEKLSIESLKDACNLLAVQNSEFLRRLALVLSLSNDTHTKMTLFESCLPEVLQFVSRACGDLKWSLEYQRNFLFGDPPTKIKKTSELSYHPDMLPFVEEIHCLDLKLQLTLQSVRGLGELLVERYSSGNKPSDEDLTELQDQLTTIDSNLARTSEHISTGIATLDKMMTPSPIGTMTPPDVPPPTDTEPTKEDTEHTEELSEEEDLVFEAYIPLDSPEDEGAEEDQLSVEERQRLEEAKEVPVNLLRELNSVLAVRNEVREKKKEEKRAKKLKQTMSQSQESAETDKVQSSSQDKALSTGGNTDEPSHIEERDSTVQKPTCVLTPSAAAVSEIKKELTKQDEEVTRGSPHLGGADQRSLAQAVAAIALRHRQQTEAIFEHTEN